MAGISFRAPHAVTETSYCLAQRFISLVVVCSTSFFVSRQMSIPAVCRNAVWRPYRKNNVRILSVPCYLERKFWNQLAGCFWVALKSQEIYSFHCVRFFVLVWNSARTWVLCLADSEIFFLIKIKMNHFILIISFSLKNQSFFNRILVRDCHIEARSGKMLKQKANPRKIWKPKHRNTRQ